LLPFAFFKNEIHYGRILGVIYLGNHDINLQMVKAVFAWHYKYYDASAEYAEAESLARTEKRGLWVDSDPINPYEFRKKQRKK